METKKYWAFISYSSKDETTARWLQKSLERFPIPKGIAGHKLADGTVVGKRIQPFFRDRTDLSASARLDTALEKALDASRYLIVICSKNSAQSYHVNEEIQYYLKNNGDERLLLIVIDGDPNATSNNAIPDDQECLAPALRQLKEPLYADLRHGKDGKVNSVLKLLACVLEVGLDELAEKRRKAALKRNLVVGILVIGAIATISFAILDSAKARLEVAEQRQVAENLVNKWFPDDDSLPPIVNSVLLGDKEAVLREIDAGADINAVYGKEEISLLMLVAASGNSEMIPWLVKHGAQVDQRSNTGETAVHHAAEYGQAKSIEPLHSVGADLDLFDNSHLRPIDDAVQAESKAVINELIRFIPIENTERNPNGYPSPLFWAAFFGHKDMVVHLLELGAKKDIESEFGDTPYNAAITGGHPDIALLLQDNKGQNTDGDARTLGEALYNLIMRIGYDSSASLENLSALIDQGADVNYKDGEGDFFGTPLSIAVTMFKVAEEESRQRAYVELIGMLIDAGADPNLGAYKQANSSLYIKSVLLDIVWHTEESNESLEVLEILLDAQVDQDQLNAALEIAIKDGKAAYKERLVKAGAVLNARASFAKPVSIFNILQSLDSPAAISQLDSFLSAKPDLSVVNQHGNTPLMIAASMQRPEVLRQLIDAGAPLEQQMKDGTTALIIAAYHGRAENLKILLENGARAAFTIDTFQGPKLIQAILVSESQSQLECTRILFANQRDALYAKLDEHIGNVKAQPNNIYALAFLADQHYLLGRLQAPQQLNQPAEAKEHLGIAVSLYQKILELIPQNFRSIQIEGMQMKNGATTAMNQCKILLSSID